MTVELPFPQRKLFSYMCSLLFLLPHHCNISVHLFFHHLLEGKTNTKSFLLLVEGLALLSSFFLVN